MTDTKNNIKPISQKSFKQIKHVIKGLKQEIKYDKVHKCDLDDDIDFGCFNNPNVDGDELSQIMDQNTDILVTTNLNVIFNGEDGMTYVVYADEDPFYDSALDLETILGIMQNLAKLGRNGIAAREKKNEERGELISKLEADMDMYASND